MPMRPPSVCRRHHLPTESAGANTANGQRAVDRHWCPSPASTPGQIVRSDTPMALPLSRRNCATCVELERNDHAWAFNPVGPVGEKLQPWLVLGSYRLNWAKGSDPGRHPPGPLSGRRDPNGHRSPMRGQGPRGGPHSSKGQLVRSERAARASHRKGPSGDVATDPP